MNLAQSIGNYVAQHRNLAGLMYVALIVICGVITLSMLTDLVDRYHARDTSLDTLLDYKAPNCLFPKEEFHLERPFWKDKR